MWSEFFTVSSLVVVLASTIRLATPFLFASLGETLGQRSGVLNLGIEGVMLIGAFSSYYAASKTGSPWMGVLAALVTGCVMGLLYAFVTLVLHAEQGISGIGVFLLGLGLTDVLFQRWVGTPIPIDGLDPWNIPFLADIPTVGEIFFQHNPLVYLSVLLVVVATVVINRTTFGLNIRAVGEAPDAADTLGISVNRTRLFTILIGNCMAGLAGAALVLPFGTFQQNLTSGRGFIAVALVYFGAWRPIGAFAGSLLFGFVLAVVNQFGALGIVSGATSSLTAMAPAILTIVVLAIVSLRIGQPAALSKPFDRNG